MNNPDLKLNKKTRRERILLELRLRPHLRTSDLAERFGVTSETIRRDVTALEGAGQVSRDFGGVTATTPGMRPDVETRNRSHLGERERIGRLAAAMVRPDDLVMIDAGSTTIQFARALAFSETPVRVITNSVNAAIILGQSRAAHVLLCPGDFMPAEAAVVGPETIDFLRRFHATQAFVGMSGISERGFSEAVPGFAGVRRAMLAQSEHLVVMADSHKFGRTDSDLVARFGPDMTLVSDCAPEPDLARAMAAEGCRLQTA
ncbi:DeoR family transcriptional regulator [Roseovarius halotolerans]|uniref:HTH-type transcriptional repressor GlcR n=1 Tax=Roseovarius halotolerans TaxID=505353 RepID=A0A1X6YN11_9RHOB|nr:DeoR/GlpR family DNA-binding transcription regulator [Roseovarius halotolerans]RKT34284.1 DeoR family transcriptional regulator [Roseovarius halotolerans]SLN25236.1 HTH-type transcriptional repressor GlcR [Roseovarius halotolerans]